LWLVERHSLPQRWTGNFGWVAQVIFIVMLAVMLVVIVVITVLDDQAA